MLKSRLHFGFRKECGVRHPKSGLTNMVRQPLIDRPIHSKLYCHAHPPLLEGYVRHHMVYVNSHTYKFMLISLR
jgi:hypothetical protein